jgi:glucose/arabinose dehydrogenase
MRPSSVPLLIGLLMLAACGEVATLPVSAGTGTRPTLPPPQRTLMPTVKIAPAQGWALGAAPIAATGTRVALFADGLDHPRWLYVLPNGDVLVAETNAPPKPDDAPGIRGWVMGLVMKRAGAGVVSANRITLLRDTDGDGVVDLRSVLLDGLNSPFGMAVVDNYLYVANSDALLRFPYPPGETRINTPGTKVLDLPAGTINHHWTKNLIASQDGRKLYVTVGSNSNVAERGMAVEAERAAIWEVDLESGKHRIFASASSLINDAPDRPALSGPCRSSCSPSMANSCPGSSGRFRRQLPVRLPGQKCRYRDRARQLPVDRFPARALRPGPR